MEYENNELKEKQLDLKSQYKQLVLTLQEKINENKLIENEIIHIKNENGLMLGNITKLEENIISLQSEILNHKNNNSSLQQTIENKDIYINKLHKGISINECIPTITHSKVITPPITQNPIKSIIGSSRSVRVSRRQ